MRYNNIIIILGTAGWPVITLAAIFLVCTAISGKMKERSYWKFFCWSVVLMTAWVSIEVFMLRFYCKSALCYQRGSLVVHQNARIQLFISPNATTTNLKLFATSNTTTAAINKSLKSASISSLFARPNFDKRPEKRGYLLVLDIPEQFNGAMRDFLELYKYSSYHLNLGLIEPYVVGTHLHFLPPNNTTELTFPTLSTYFNASYLLSILKACFNSDTLNFHTFTNFLLHASRNFIVVKFITRRKMLQGMENDIEECSVDLKSIEVRLNSLVKQVEGIAVEKSEPGYFKGVSSICVKSIPDEPTSFQKVAEFIRNWMNKQIDLPAMSKHFSPQFTVIIPEWRSYLNQKSNHYYFDPSLGESNLTKSCKWKSTPFTPYVMTEAETMLIESGLSRPFIAVHLRTERASQPEIEYGHRGFMDRCINNFKITLEKIRRERNIGLENVVYIHDGGPYGSDSMWESRRKAFNYLISKMTELGIRNIHYSPKPNNSTGVDKGLAQFVELQFLVSADVLILMGYGGYQYTLTQRFLSKTGGDKTNIHHICQKP